MAPQLASFITVLRWSEKDWIDWKGSLVRISLRLLVWIIAIAVFSAAMLYVCREFVHGERGRRDARRAEELLAANKHLFPRVRLLYMGAKTGYRPILRGYVESEEQLAELVRVMGAVLDSPYVGNGVRVISSNDLAKVLSDL